MSLFESPSINTRYACIVSDKKPVIGAMISSYFNDPEVYFPVFVFPNVNRQYSDTNDFQDDGYIARAIGAEAATLINNAIAKLGPEKVFLAGLTEDQKTYIREFLPPGIIVEVDSIDEVEQAMTFLNKRFNVDLRCKTTEVIQGLLFAKYTNSKLLIDDAADTLDTRLINGGKGAVVIENENDSDNIVAINYAFSIGVDVFLVDPIERSEMHGLQKHIYQWKKQGSTDAYNKIRKKVNNRIRGIKFKKYLYCTFFTQGLPYGLVLNNTVPFTHVLKDLRSDLFILNNIAYEDLEIEVNSAIVFSPKEFKYEETEDVIATLESNNYFVKRLLDSEATVRNFSNYVGHYSHDLLHICSHGGETDGYYVIAEFEDRKGQTHKVEYEEVVGFSPHDSEKVNVFSKAIFRRFDGSPWMSKELESKNIPSYIFEDMRKALFQNDDKDARVLRVPANYPIYTSCHIKCYDSIHQGQFHSIAANGSPLIFNNTCSSWYEIATHFIAGGARGYIGTIWNVDNAVAIKAAKIFYDKVFKQKNIMIAAHIMNKQATTPQYQDIYIFWGLHFSTLKQPSTLSDEEVFSDLMVYLMQWIKKYSTTKIPEVRKNCIPIMNFIRKEIITNFTPEHLMKLEAELDAIKEPLSEPSEHDSITERGVLDL